VERVEAFWNRPHPAERLVKSLRPSVCMHETTRERINRLGHSILELFNFLKSINTFFLDYFIEYKTGNFKVGVVMFGY
jgi:hypothetical protein